MIGAEETASPPAENVRPVSDLYSSRQRGLFLFVLFLVSTSNYVDRNIIGVLLPSIKTEFRVSDTMLGLLSGISFALFYATLGIPVARWADRGDRKLIITIALGLWSVMTVLCGFAQSFAQLALMRVGVGVGEAGAIPPSQSLLADYYASDRRAKALGVFMMSATAGYVLGLVLGGWVAQNYGWRMAFVVVGAPGLLLMMIVHWSLKEPRRLQAFAPKPQDHESIGAAFGALLRKRAYVWILMSMILYFLMAYGALVFMTSFLVRAHGLSVAQSGALYGILAAVAAIIGNTLGGAVADFYAARDVAWFCRLPGYALILCWPLFELTFLAPSVAVMAPILFIASVILSAVVPPMFSALHVVCGSKRRAMAVAIAFLFANLIGLGLGPIIAGVLSDTLSKIYGQANGLRYALMAVMTVFVPSGLFILRAGRHMAADTET